MLQLEEIHGGSHKLQLISVLYLINIIILHNMHYMYVYLTYQLYTIELPGNFSLPPSPAPLKTKSQSIHILQGIKN